MSFFIFVTNLQCFCLLGGGFKDFYVHPYLGKISNFDQYFSKGLKPPIRRAFHDFSVFYGSFGAGLKP